MRWTIYRAKIGYIYTVNYCWFIWWHLLCWISKLCAITDAYPREQLTTCNPSTKVWATTADPSVAALVRNIITYVNQIHGTNHDASLAVIRGRIPHSYIAWVQYYDILHNRRDQISVLRTLSNLKLITPDIYMELLNPDHAVYRRTDMLCGIMDRPLLDYQQLIDNYSTIKE